MIIRCDYYTGFSVMDFSSLRAAAALTTILSTVGWPLLVNAQAAYEYKTFRQGLVVSAPTPPGVALPELSTTSLNWDPAVTPVPVNGSGTQYVLLMNQGTAGLRLVSAPAVTGSGQFTSTTGCLDTLAAGASCSTAVTYAPTDTAAAQGVLSIETSEGLKTVTLTGTPAYSAASITGIEGTAFGSVLTGLSKSLSFTVKNTGSVPMTQVHVKADAAAVTTTSSNCGTEGTPLPSLAAGESCSVTVTWSPSVPGALSTVLKVFASGASVGQTALTGSAVQSITVKLQGTGYRTWSDGSIAASCNEYFKPSSPRLYQGDTGDGLYRIQPAGQAATTVYCDMTRDGGGWTLVVKAQQNSNAHANSAAVGTLTGPNQATVAKFSDAFITAIPKTMYRMTSASGTGSVYFDTSDSFASTRQAANRASTTWSNPVWEGPFYDSAHRGLNSHQQGAGNFGRASPIGGAYTGFSSTDTCRLGVGIVGGAAGWCGAGDAATVWTK